MPIKGRMKYLPSMVMEEIEQIKRENRIFKDNYAMREMVKYARVGRELERIKNFNFTKPPLRSIMKKRRR